MVGIILFTKVVREEKSKFERDDFQFLIENLFWSSKEHNTLFGRGFLLYISR